MILKKIKIQKFKSIYDELELDFGKVHGFWKISGSVGSGKTTIGEAIIFGLFGTISGKTNDSLISWGEKHACVETWCTSKGRDIYIRREINKYGQSPIYVTVDGEELIFTNKRDGQQQLESEYYDVSRTTLELLCIISFNNFKSLSTLNASDTKKFLDQVLGFSILSSYSDTCRELRKLPHQECLQVLRQIDSNNDQIRKINELTNIAHIEGDITETQANIKRYEADRDNILRDIDNELVEKRKVWTNLQAQLTKIKTLGSNKKKEIDFIKKGTCPTCGAPIDQSQLSIKEQEREVLLDQYKSVSKQADDAQKEIQRIENIRSTKVSDYRNLIQFEQNQLIKLQEQEKRSEINRSVIDDLRICNDDLAIQADQLSADEAEWDELLSILSETVRSKILASFIPSLNKNILKFTQQLQQRYIIEFDPSFKCNIRICGMEDTIPFSSLSTGQLKTVDMCIIMGVLGTIMNNISFNITFLDELISNMDYDLRSIMCRVLKQNMKPNQTLFILSHVDLEAKYFDGEVHAKLEYIDESHLKSVYSIESYDPE